MKFLPREEKFFTDFQDQVKIISEAALILQQGVRAGNDEMREAAIRIKTLEVRGDDLIHDIFVRLNKTFITPLDPEDIHSIASHLDDVLDGIEEAAHRLAAHGVQPIPPPVLELTDIIVLCAENLQKAFEALAAGRPLLDHCIELNRLEDAADGIFRHSMADLFLNEKDAIQLIRVKEVYENLEVTTDYCENVADMLQEVVVKNG